MWSSPWEGSHKNSQECLVPQIETQVSRNLLTCHPEPGMQLAFLSEGTQTTPRLSGLQCLQPHPQLWTLDHCPPASALRPPPHMKPAPTEKTPK